jgi:hypothetical protein
MAGLNVGEIFNAQTHGIRERRALTAYTQQSGCAAKLTEIRRIISASITPGLLGSHIQGVCDADSLPIPNSLNVLSRPTSRIPRSRGGVVQRLSDNLLVQGQAATCCLSLSSPSTR